MNIYNTLLSYFLISMWPIVFGLISTVYCSMFRFSPSRRFPLTLLSSPYTTLFSPAQGSVCPVPELEWLFDLKQIFPSHGHRLRGDGVHNTSGNLPRGYQRDRTAHATVGQLGGDSLQLLSRGDGPFSALENEPSRRHWFRVYSLVCPGLRHYFLPHLRLCRGSTASLFLRLQCCSSCSSPEPGRSLPCHHKTSACFQVCVFLNPFCFPSS